MLAVINKANSINQLNLWSQPNDTPNFITIFHCKIQPIAVSIDGMQKQQLSTLRVVGLMKVNRMAWN